MAAGEPQSEMLFGDARGGLRFCQGTLPCAGKSLVWMQLRAAVKNCYKSCASHGDIRLFAVAPLVLIFTACGLLLQVPYSSPVEHLHTVKHLNHSVEWLEVFFCFFF